MSPIQAQVTKRVVAVTQFSEVTLGDDIGYKKSWRSDNVAVFFIVIWLKYIIFEIRMMDCQGVRYVRHNGLVSITYW